MGPWIERGPHRGGPPRGARSELSIQISAPARRPDDGELVLAADTIVVVDGPAVSGPALLLGIADFTIMTDRSSAFVNGPVMVEEFTGVAIRMGKRPPPVSPAPGDYMAQNRRL